MYSLTHSHTHLMHDLPPPIHTCHPPSTHATLARACHPHMHATHHALMPSCLPAAHACSHSHLPTHIPPHMPACSHAPHPHTLPTPASMAALSFFPLSFLSYLK